MDARRYRDVTLLVASLALAAAVFAPGMTGGFHFDDFPNFTAMFGQGKVGDLDALLRFVTSGTADPIGRPVALLSFLPQAHAWPSGPEAFLAVNLGLHLLNGVLLYAFLRVVRPGQVADPAWHWTCLVAAILWLVHPLHVSTVMYAIQREAMLPATFALIAFIAYCSGRQRFFASDGREGAIRMILAVVVGTGFAALCKANGLLVPALLLVLEATIFPGPAGSIGAAASRRFRQLRGLVLVVPTLTLIASLAWLARDWDATPVARDWTVFQRAITQPRILLDYLGLLIVPRSGSSGLFNDAYVVSTGWLDPLSTAISAAIVLGMAGLAIAGRRRQSLAAAAMLFFLTGHLLESTVIPLELYYEHRNYLPSLLFFLPLAHWLMSVPARPAVAAMASVGLVMLLAFTTFQRASLWGQPARLTALWLIANPESSRAQAAASRMEVREGRAAAAAQRLAAFWDRHPNDLQIAFAFVAASCEAGGLSAEAASRVSDALRYARAHLLFVNPWLTRSLHIAESGRCRGLSLPLVGSWIEAAAKNPTMRRVEFSAVELEPVIARWHVACGRPEAGLRHYNKALARTPRPAIAASQASDLAEHGHFDLALRHLDFYRTLPPHRESRSGMPRLHALLLQRQHYWDRELAHLRSNLELARAATPPAPQMDGPRP